MVSHRPARAASRRSLARDRVAATRSGDADITCANGTLRIHKNQNDAAMNALPSHLGVGAEFLGSLNQFPRLSSFHIWQANLDLRGQQEEAIGWVSPEAHIDLDRQTGSEPDLLRCNQT
jgi:hypothetical protein